MASRIAVSQTAFRQTSRRLKRVEVRSDDHLAFIRSLPCLVTGVYQRIQAAHVSYADPRFGKLGRGMGTKEDDIWTVPLEAEQHELQHKIGEGEYWPLANIDPVRIAAALYIFTGDRERALMIIEHARDK